MKEVGIEISDNGSGIPPAIQSKIFEPYLTTKQVGEGTGLGLASVYGFMKKSKGLSHFNPIRMEPHFICYFKH